MSGSGGGKPSSYTRQITDKERESILRSYGIRERRGHELYNSPPFIEKVLITVAVTAFIVLVSVGVVTCEKFLTKKAEGPIDNTAQHTLEVVPGERAYFYIKVVQRGPVAMGAIIVGEMVPRAWYDPDGRYSDEELYEYFGIVQADGREIDPQWREFKEVADELYDGKLPDTRNIFRNEK